MKKTNLLLILLIVFAIFVCTTGVASAITLREIYVGNTVVDLTWSKYGSDDFSCYELYRGGSKIATISDRNTTFYRDTGPSKGVMYYYKIEVLDDTGGLRDTDTRRITTGYVHGTITRDTMWTAATSPYNLSGIVVEEDVTLTISPGVTVTKAPYTLSRQSVEVYGTLSSESATFDAVLIKGGWEERGSRHLSVRHCLFNDGGLTLRGNDSSVIGNTLTGDSDSEICIEILGCNNTVKNNILMNTTYTTYGILCQGILSGGQLHHLVAGNTIAGNTLSGVGISLSHAYNNTLTSNTVLNSGISLSSSSNSTLTGNTVSNNSGCGIILGSSSHCTLADNVVSNNGEYGIYMISGYCTLTGNVVSNNGGYGILMEYYDPALGNNTLTGNTVSNNSGHGIRLSSHCTLTGNTVSNNSGHGILLGNNNTLTSNTVSNNTLTGIQLWNNNTLTGNTVSNNGYAGIVLGNNNTLTGNTVSNNSGYGIRISNNCTLTGNTVSNNSGYGILLSNNCTLTGNTVSNNSGYGIYLISSNNNNTIYNNYFNNTHNAYDDGDNIWNITKTPGLNIAGGPYLGGNCWSDYVGNDTDGDRLGDTLLPYNSAGHIIHGGDYHPLICEPIDVSVSDIIAKVLVDGENATVNATVHTDAGFNVSYVTVRLVVNDTTIQDKLIVIPKNSSTNVTFDWWNVSWSVKDNKKQPTKIEVIIDPDDVILETNETNNTVSREFLLVKGEKKNNADGKGFVAKGSKSRVYGVPIAIWFDDDATKSKKGVPTRHYNPIASNITILNDIDTYFKGTQYPNGIDNLNISDFNSDAEKTFTTYWGKKRGMGIVIVEETGKSAIAAAPIASYLNWPMAPSTLISSHPDTAKELIRNLSINYTLVIASNKTTLNTIINDLKNLNLTLDDNQTIFVKGYVVEPLNDLEPTDLFKEVLDAFGDKSPSIVVTNSRTGSSLASAPLAAFYKSMILDVRDVVTGPVSYAPNTFAGLNPINNQVNSIIDKAGEHDIKGFISKYMAKAPNKTLYLVGTAKSVPFGIERDPCGNAGVEAADSDWIASDYRYYHAHPNIEPGGRMPQDAENNFNYVACALQFDELPVGDRDVGDGWEDNIMGVGVYNPSGERRWANNQVWWLDSAVYQVRDLSNKAVGMEVTRLFEDASAHNGGWGENWYRFDNRWGQVIQKAPLYWDTSAPLANPVGGGNRSDGVNNDGDKIGCENNNGNWPIERITDNNNNGVYDAGDVILNAGLIPGIQSAAFGEQAGLTSDEEVWDGYDNDGDGTIDEDCSFWHLLEVEDVYNEKLTAADPDIDPGDFADLIDINLINELDDKGIIIYSGHSWTDTWAIHNIGGNNDPDGAGPIPPLTSDNRTGDQIELRYDEVPAMAPSLVIASSCGSSRLWEANCIALEFLKRGSLAYIGSTSLAYGSSDEFRQQMFNQIAGGRLHIGRAFQSAVDDLDQNDLWANRFNESNIYADKTRYEFNLFGLGSTEIDPGEGEKRVAYGTPVYDSDTKTWSMNITFDIPEPMEIEDAGGNVTKIIFPTDLLKWLSDDASYPALYILPFDYEFPVGGNFSNISLVNATVYKVYNFSQYMLKDYGKWPVEIVPVNMSLNETLDEELELYDGPLFPDVLFVNGSECDSLANRDRVFGSVTAWQIDGTINKTTVYDKIVLKLTYTAPVGVEERHVVDGKDLTVYATIVSTDGKTHLVKPSLVIETVGGIFYREVSAENITVGEIPQTVTFEVSEIELPKYVGSVIVTEEGKFVAETSFTVTLPKIVINEVYPYPSAVQDAKEEWIEIYNAGEREVNLTGWRIVDGDSELNYTIPANDSDWDGVLESGSYLVFHVGGTLDTPAEDIYGNFTSGVLNDTNDSISLLSANGTGIDFVRYGNCTDEPPTGTTWTGINPDAPVQGQSIGRDKVSTDTNDGNDWENTGGIDVDGPTPGLRNFEEGPPPNITSFAPPSPVNDIVCIWRTFNVTVNQTVNVSWYLNESFLFTNESVTEAGCMLHAEVVGEHNVSAITTNPNGTDMQTWIWNVTPTPIPGVVFDTGSGTYPSIFGTHNGTITPNQTINVSKLYTYPCVGTGGHTEYARIWNSTLDEIARWDGYKGDWHNISFNEIFTLVANETYNYTLKTGSYPQIHHTPALPTANGWINCTEFRDANGKIYYDWIPAIKLYF